MNDQDLLNRILATMTPERMRAIIQDLASKQAPDDRSGVTLGAIYEVLMQRKDMGEGPESWRVFLKLKQMVMDMVAQIPGMKYIEADA